MGALRDQIAADAAAILASSDEFGGQVDVDGVLVPGVLDEDTSSASLRGRTTRAAEGVFVDEKVLYVRKVDLVRVPVPDQRLVVNGGRYTVTRVNDSMGLLAIGLAWYDA